jgi:pilus assembly protein Flp/PilA
MNALKNLIRDDNGATMVEYGIIVALIAAACIIVIGTLGTKIQSEFSTINSDL